MKINCPHCGKAFDVAVKTVLVWVDGSELLQKAVGSLLGRIHGKKVNPEKQARTPEQASKAAGIRWAKYRAEQVENGKKESKVGEE